MQDQRLSEEKSEVLILQESRWPGGQAWTGYGDLKSHSNLQPLAIPTKRSITPSTKQDTIDQSKSVWCRGGEAAAWGMVRRQ